MNSTRPPFNFSPAERRDYEASVLRFTAAAHLENLLDHAGLQAKDLAKRIGKSRSWISKLLSGRQNATLDTLAEVALALGARWKIDLVAAERAGTPAEHDVEPPEWALPRSNSTEVVRSAVKLLFSGLHGETSAVQVSPLSRTPAFQVSRLALSQDVHLLERTGFVLLYESERSSLDSISLPPPAAQFSGLVQISETFHDRTISSATATISMTKE